MSVSIQVNKRMVSGDRHFELDVAFTSSSKRIALFGPSGAGTVSYTHLTLPTTPYV